MTPCWVATKTRLLPSPAWVSRMGRNGTTLPEGGSGSQPAHLRSGKARAVCSGSGVSSTSAPGTDRGDRRQGAGLHVGDQDELAGRIEADVGGGLEALGQQHRLLAGPGDAEDLAVLVIADEQAAELVPGQPVAAAEAVRDLGRRPIGDPDAVQFAGMKIEQQHEGHAIHRHAVGRHQGRVLVTGDQRDLLLWIDPEEGPVLAPQVARVGDVQVPLLVHVHVIEETRLGGERFRGSVHFHLALGVDAQDALLVRHEEPLLERHDSLGIVKAGGKGNRLAIPDFDDRAVAVLVELADLRDVDLAVPDRDRFRVLQPGDQRFGQSGLGRDGKPPRQQGEAKQAEQPADNLTREEQTERTHHVLHSLFV